MTEPKIQYQIEAVTLGESDAQQLAGALREVGEVLDKDLKQDALAAAAALQTLSEKQTALDKFAKAAADAQQLAAQLQGVHGKAEQLGTTLAEAADRAEAFAKVEAQARAAVEAKATALELQRAALRELQRDNVGAARSTDEYKQASTSLTAEIQRLGAELAIDRAALRDMAKETREAETEARALARQYDKSVGALQAVSAGHEKADAAMQAERQTAQRLGLETANLGQQQAALARAVDEQRAAAESAAAALARLRESQARASAVAAEFQGRVSALGIDGVQAPAALEQAFRKLGMSGVKPAEAAIHELQIALAQIRDAPDILPADKRAAVAAFNQKVAELRAHAQEAAGATAQLGAATQATGTSLGQAAQKAAAWAAALVGLQQLKGIAAQVVDTGAQFETLHVRLGNLLGSTEAANRAFAMLKQLASSTPFDVAGLTESFVKLTAFGMQPTEQQMRSLADIAANLGGGTEALSAVTLALGQAWTKTKLQGEEILQLAERGVPVWDALARATGRTVPELQRMSEAGLLGRDVIAKLIDELGRMNEGASDKLMRTYAGAVANAKDALAEFFDMVAKAGVLDWLTDKVRELLAEFERMKETGELQKKAQELADAFIAVANAADMAARGLVFIAPAVAEAVKVFVALKALQLGQTMLGIATGATQAAVAVGAAGAAGTAASVGLTAASVAARSFAISIRMIPGAAALWALGEAAGALLAKLLGVKPAADGAKKGMDELMAPPAANGPEKAAQQAVKALSDLEKRTGDAVKEFDKLMAKGASTDQALNQIAKDFDLSSVPGIKAMPAVLDQLVGEFKITAEQVRAAWEKALNGVNLREFEVMARHAFALAEDGGRQLQQAIDAGLREAVRRAVLEFGAISGGMGKAAASALADLGVLIENLDRLKEQGADTGRVLVASLSKAIDTADGEKALEAVRAKIEQVRSVLGDKVADGLLEQAKQKAEALKDALDAATPGINSVREAMKQLGVTSDESLKKTAATAKDAYDTLTASGTASARELGEGFKKAAEAAIAANNGVAPAWVAASAAMRGFDLEVDKAGKSTLRLREATDKAADAHGRAARATRDQATELERLNAVREREIAAQEKANQLKEREIALYLKKWNMDSQHRSLDADGKVREETGMPTRKGIYDRAKQGGLGDADALAFADAFDTNRLRDTGSRGTPFINLQKLDDAIADAVLEAVRRGGENASKDGGTAERTGGTGSTGEPSGRAGRASSTGITHVVNLQIGIDKARYPVPTNAAGSQQLQSFAREFIRELEAAKSTAGR